MGYFFYLSLFSVYGVRTMCPILFDIKIVELTICSLYVVVFSDLWRGWNTKS